MRFAQLNDLQRHEKIHLRAKITHGWKGESCGRFLSEKRSILRHHKNCQKRKKDEKELFKVPEIPKINTRPQTKMTPDPSKEKTKNLFRKRKNLNIKARQIINEVMHYHFNEKNKDGSITERWLPIWEIEDFNDVVEFEKLIAKIEIGSEEDLFIPKEEFFL